MKIMKIIPFFFQLTLALRIRKSMAIMAVTAEPGTLPAVSTSSRAKAFARSCCSVSLSWSRDRVEP